MLDINLLRTNPELVKENIRKKFQDEKLVMVDEVVEMDKEYRAAIQQADTLRNQIKVASKQIGMLMGKGQKEEAEKAKEQVAVYKADLEGLAAKEDELQAEIRKRMLVIPNIIDPSVPIGKDDSQNVEIERFGEPVVPDFEIPYHVDIMERLHGIDLDSARRTSGNGFYYLMGDIARLHSAILSYGRDFMIDRGFTYCIPPYMIHGDVVTGVMSFAEMENMMYKIEGEDLYLIGTSEHTMIGRFIDQTLDESKMPLTLTSYSPCFRKEKGAHGIEERGIYRIHQFEKQEMIVVCRPEESADWYEKLWKMSVELFRSQNKTVGIQKLLPVANQEIPRYGVDAAVNSPRILNLLDPKRHQDGGALSGEGASGGNAAQAVGQGRIEPVLLLIPQDGELAGPFLSDGLQGLGVRVQLVQGVRNMDQRDIAVDHALVTGAEII